MRTTAAAAAMVMLFSACGTPQRAGLASEATRSSVSAETTYPTGATAQPAFDVASMDRLFPLDRSSFVVWGSCCGGLGSRVLRVRVGDADGLIWDESFEVAEADSDSRQFLVEIDVEPGSYRLEADISMGADTTDGTAGTAGTNPVQCEAAVEVVAGEANALTLSYGGACYWTSQPLWRTTGGDPVSDTQILESGGTSACGWEAVVFLSMSDGVGSVFARDPDGVFGSDWYAPGGSEVTDTTGGTTTTTVPTGEFPSFGLLDELPSDAADSGYRSNGRELWLSESDGYAYLRTATTVERWPHIGPEVVLCLG